MTRLTQHHRPWHPGFSGADLANLVNEAALVAARANKRLVGVEEFERARDKIMMGAERRTMVMNEKKKLIPPTMKRATP